MISLRAVRLDRKVKILEPEKLQAFAQAIPEGTELEATFRRWSDGRSLRANALFHELVGRYSKALGIAFEVVKMDLKKHYGVWVSAESALADQPAWNGRFVDYHGDLVFVKSTADYTIREFSELTKGAMAECFDNGVDIEDIKGE
jgi:hypothetical protein